MEAFFVKFGGYEEQIFEMVMGVAIELLVTLGIFLWIRRFVRAWAERTGRPIDKRIAGVSQHFLLPIIALGVAFLIFSFTPLVPTGLAGVGKKLLLGGTIVLVLVLGGRLSLLFLERLGEYHEISKVFLKRLRGPIWVVLGAGVYALLTYFLAPSERFLQVLPKTMLIVALAWLILQGAAAAADTANQTYVKHLEAVDPTRARSFDTLIGVSKRVVTVVVVLITAMTVLEQFDFFRTLTNSLLASAGIAGLVVGLAAQRSLGNLFAGVQLALTQPVSIGDSVVFENEWGWIEGIFLTYVVIRTWDQRRLVVPINYLMDRPIQNWTKVSPDMIGTVYIYTDYRIDVEAVRQELARILGNTELWNRKVPPVLQTTDCKEHTVELRALCSAANAPTAWELRCLVREKLLAYIQQIENGRFLPRTRVEFERQAIESV